MTDVPDELLNCMYLFLHQIEINDYTTTDKQHDLKMNVYYPAVKSLYDLILKLTDKSPEDPVLRLLVRWENACRSYLPSDPELIEKKQWIENASYQSLLHRWRFAPVGDPMFSGDLGEHYKRIINIKRAIDGDEATIQASKSIGWSE